MHLLMAALLGGMAAAPAAAQLPPPEPIEQIKGDLYKIFGGGGNTLVYVRDNDVVLVDTKMPGNGEAILEQVRAITDKPITTIIYSHHHPDHVGSTAFFREHFPEVKVISHENAKGWVEASPNVDPGQVPDETFTDRLTVGEGDDRIELYYFGAGHTNADAWLVFPEEKVLFPGDMMAWDMAPLIDPGTGGDVRALPDTLERVAETVQGVETVVEGHGAINNWTNFLRFRDFNRALMDAAKAAYDKGEEPAAAVAALQANPQFAPLLDTNIKKGLEYGNTPLARAHMNVNVAYQMMSGEDVTTNFGAPLPETDKHKGSNPADTAMPGRPAPAPAPAN